ncbi:ABC transporter permease [Streptomyces sp. NPDC005438]|uniref:ABC transporter permease n=1 Tax=Streptomyces sp. NPDC005438 TaxID=3156880 RepID=UPI0033BC2C1B
MLVLANIRERWTGFLASFVAVLVGVALITTTLVLHDSARPKTQPRLTSTTALALAPKAPDQDGTSRDRVPWSPGEARSLVERLAALPGVTSAVADRAFYAQAFRHGEPVADEGALEAGHGWSSVRLGPEHLVTGRAPTSAGEVVVDRALGVPVGGRLTVNLSAGRTPFRVVGTLDGPGYWFTDAFAARQQPGVRAIALRTDDGTLTPGAERRARHLLGDRGELTTGDQRAALQPEFVDHKRFLGTQLLGAMALLSLFTTLFAVASMLALSTTLRRREIGLLRTVGAAPHQIRRMILGEAAVVGLLGSLAGCLAGVAAAPALRNLLRGLDVTPPDLTLRVSAWPLLTAAGVGVGISVLGAWSASRRAARIAPVEALSQEGAAGRPLGRGRAVGGLATLGVGGLLAVVTATASADDRVNSAILATMALIVAATLLAPVVVAPAARMLTAPFHRLGSASPLLVRAELRAHPGRAAALAAPVIAAVGFAVLLTGMVETMRVAYPAGDAHRLRGQVIVAPDGTPGHSAEVVGAHPVGKAVVPTRAFVPDREGRRTVVDALGSRDPRWDRPGQAVLGRRMAEHLGVRAGDHRPVRFADGTTVRLRIARVLPDDPARGDFVVSRRLVRDHDPAALTDDLFVPAASRPTSAYPGTTMREAVRYALEDYATDARLTDSLAVMLVVIAVGYSGIALTNGMAMAAHQRRRELAVLRTAGGTRGQLLLFSLAETSLVVTVGAALGALVPLGPLTGMASGLSQVTSTPVRLRLDPTVLAGVTLSTLLLAATANLLVTRWALRGEATGTEDRGT